MERVVVVTRAGCRHTPTMRTNLEGALRSLGMAAEYGVADLDTLPSADHRRGFPTPTLLYDGVDLFGMEAPTPPFPEPS